MTATVAPGSRRQRLGELARLFLRIGLTGFGGPAVTIAMMQDEVVTRRGWLSRERFLDLMGLTNLIPGPNAAEMSIHIGYVCGGWAGLAVAGACFILPAAIMTTLLAWAYVTYGALPRVAPLLYGIKPAVIAVVLAALWRLGRTAVRSWQMAVIGAGVIALALVGVDEILAMFIGGIVGGLWLRLPALRRDRRPPTALAAALLALVEPGALAAPALATPAIAAAAPSLLKLALFLLKTGAVLYGSGYVLVAFLEAGLVRDYGWLTQQQLLDAIAAGQFTPGPLLSTSAFVGYLLFGLPGAAVSTLAVFLPSFIFVVAISVLMPNPRRSPWTSAFLDAINVSSLALMAIVTVQLGRAALGDWPTCVIAAAAAVVGLRWKVNSAWLVLGGALAGWLAHWLGLA
ncbi:MAG: chromate efflux transporter [Chloroflexota bacterium]